jgi:hypothetical protein
LKEKVAAPVKKMENSAVRIRHEEHVAPSIRKNSQTFDGRSIGIVRSRTQATEFKFKFTHCPLSGSWDVFYFRLNLIL